MSTKQEQKDELDFLRKGTGLDIIHGLPEERKDPAYEYRLMTVVYSKPNPTRAFRFQKLEKLGWEVVYEDGIGDIDDRDSSPKEKPNTRKSPLWVTKSNGNKALWMRIPKELKKQHDEEQAKANAMRLEQASGIYKHGSGGVKVIGPEVTCEQLIKR